MLHDSSPLQPPQSAPAPSSSTPQPPQSASAPQPALGASAAFQGGDHGGAPPADFYSEDASSGYDYSEDDYSEYPSTAALPSFSVPVSPTAAPAPAASQDVNQEHPSAPALPAAPAPVPSAAAAASQDSLPGLPASQKIVHDLFQANARLSALKQMPELDETALAHVTAVERYHLCIYDHTPHVMPLAHQNPY